jgi:polysaccharide biosynthesis protein PslE
LAILQNRAPALAMSMRDAIMPVFRHRRLVTLIFLGIFLGAILGTLVLPRKYEAQMKILVNRERVDAVVTPDPDNVNGPGIVPAVSEEDLNSEVELIKSRDLLERVAIACALNSESKSGWKRWLERVGNAMRGTGTTPQTQLARAVQDLEQRLIVDPMKKTDLIRVTYASHDPAQAAQVLQTLATMYQEKHAAVHRPPGTFLFFEQETARYREELANAEARLMDFNSREGIVEAATQKQLVLQQLSQFEAEWQQAQTNSHQAGARAQALRRQAAATPARQTTQVTTIANAQLLATLESTLLSLEMKRSELLTKYAPSYTPVREVELQIRDARTAITEAQQSPAEQVTTDRLPAQDWMTTELARAETDRAALDAQSDATAQVVRRYEGMARTLDAKGTQQVDLARNVKTAEDNYVLYVRKREEARISDALDSKRIVNVAIAEAATVPALPTLHLAWILIGGFFAAGIVSVGSAYAVDRLDGSFHTPDELHRYLDTRVLASIPSGEAGE